MSEAPQSTTRLNKFLAHAKGLSRRAADELIEAGRVAVNGHPALLGAQIHPEDSITIDGKVIDSSVEYTTLLFNKPVGYVCSRRQQGDTPTIYSLLPPEYQELKPVGRLDKDSSGLILLTNDGDLAYEMTHPKFHKVKIYEVELDAPLQPLHHQMISDFGVMLPDGKSKFELERLEEESNTSWRITMSEGRNRQIRRTFAALGYTVVALHRTQFGPYNLSDLAEGALKPLTLAK